MNPYCEGLVVFLERKPMKVWGISYSPTSSHSVSSNSSKLPCKYSYQFVASVASDLGPDLSCFISLDVPVTLGFGVVCSVTLVLRRVQEKLLVFSLLSFLLL